MRFHSLGPGDPPGLTGSPVSGATKALRRPTRRPCSHVEGSARDSAQDALLASPLVTCCLGDRLAHCTVDGGRNLGIHGHSC